MQVSNNIVLSSEGSAMDWFYRVDGVMTIPFQGVRNLRQHVENKVAAIKILRAMNSIGLKEAKDIIDHYDVVSGLAKLL